MRQALVQQHGEAKAALGYAMPCASLVRTPLTQLRMCVHCSLRRLFTGYATRGNSSKVHAAVSASGCALPVRRCRVLTFGDA